MQYTKEDHAVMHNKRKHNEGLSSTYVVKTKKYYISDKVVSVLNQKLFFKLSDEAVMLCPFRTTSSPIIWLGPVKGKLTTYSDGTHINSQIPSYDRLHVVGNHLEGEYNLKIENVTKNDTGQYICNSILNGERLRGHFFLQILEKPRTHKNKSIFKFRTNIGDPATVDISVITSQKPIVAWTENVGGRLGQWAATVCENETIFRISSTISPTSHSHFGMYGIRVRNDVGSLHLQLELELIDYPVTIMPVKVYCNASTKVTLTCKLHVVESGGWQNIWTHSRNDKYIKTVSGKVILHTSSVEIKFCDYREEGDYTCTWKNSLNEYSTSSMVKSNGPPTITGNVFNVTSFVLCMSVYFYSPHEKISARWFRNDKLVRNDTRWTITIFTALVQLNYSEKIIREKGFSSKLCVSNFTRNNVTDEPEYLVPVSEYEEIDDIQMGDINSGNFDQASTDEHETEEDLLENPNGISSEAQVYQDIDESRFEIHKYTEFKQ
ncbi:Hypothetical predicted protein [Mytilus galloprovincialis]|uniref:Ig-like domain-containing protein n=1 Tax=Mytilus galloprovincialis TaxID=29158 RepID=A0A8B6G7C1_MYTGA|nr:Hypothetical predicted protein [Mytilus galloprovincialis]